MNGVSGLILTIYFAVLILLAIYGVHRYWIVYLYYKHRKSDPLSNGGFAELPRVTVQLPIFNERYVVERLIDAVARLDYPGDRLEIQVLDDSTDETAAIARRRALLHRARGVDIHYLRRESREGFKAGALAFGLRRSRGDFIAIFDADFVPERRFLRQTMPYFADPDVGMVQVRWGHINGEYSLLTRVQAILLDGHFILEHGGRHRSGRFFNFNGTAGVWRRAAIEDAGGWQHDTLTEDLDLSYRAQLRNWRFLFLPDVVSPAEVPVEMNAFKSQQFRWSKGSIQTAKKLLLPVLASRLSLGVKSEALFHLTANLAYPLMLLLSLLMFPSLLVRYNMGWYEMLWADVPLFLAATGSVSSFYIVSQREIYADWKRRLKYLPCLMALGIGMSVNNTRAVLQGLVGRQSPFVRTPKYGIESPADRWEQKHYRRREGRLALVEVSLGIHFTLVIAFAVMYQIYATLPFLILFQIGYLYTGLASLLQDAASRRSRVELVEGEKA